MGLGGDDYAKLHFYLVLVNSALSLGAVIYTWWNNREKAISRRFGHITTDVETLKADMKVVKENPSIHCQGHVQMAQRMENHAERISNHREALTGIETELKHLPKTSDIGKLHDKINGVDAHLSDLGREVGKIAGAMPGITHTIEMMNEYLINQGGKR